jgi:hypothetical protein
MLKNGTLLDRAQHDVDIADLMAVQAKFDPPNASPHGRWCTAM